MRRIFAPFRAPEPGRPESPEPGRPQTPKAGQREEPEPQDREPAHEPPASQAGVLEGLRETWSRYPGEWEQSAALRKGADTLGDEWGGPEFADLVIELVERYLGQDVDVLELGCGGGKFSGRLAPKCRSLLCADISAEMIEHTRSTLGARGLDGNVHYRVLNGVDFAGVPDESVDFIFSYDVQIHLQPENVFSYMKDARRVLRDQGVMMVHQANLASYGGVYEFLSQYGASSWKHEVSDPRRRGYVHFMSAEGMRTLGELARLVVDDLVEDFPPREARLWAVTSGRDLIGFFKLRPSRLRNIAPESVRLVRAEGHDTVYALLDGARVAFLEAWVFMAAGFRMEKVEVLDPEDLAALPEGEPLAYWE